MNVKCWQIENSENPKDIFEMGFGRWRGYQQLSGGEEAMVEESGDLVFGDMVVHRSGVWRVTEREWKS